MGDSCDIGLVKNKKKLFGNISLPINLKVKMQNLKFSEYVFHIFQSPNKTHFPNRGNEYLFEEKIIIEIQNANLIGNLKLRGHFQTIFKTAQHLFL